MQKVLKRQARIKEDKLVVWLARITVGVVACLLALEGFIALINALEPAFGRFFDKCISYSSVILCVGLVALVVLLAVDGRVGGKEE